MKNSYFFLTKPFVIGSVKVIPALRKVELKSGQTTELSQRQMQGLFELVKNYGEVVERGKMHEILCLTEEGLRDPGALSHHISAIRKAFGDSSKQAKYIKTVRGLGYCLLQEPKSLSDEQRLAVAMPKDLGETSFFTKSTASSRPLSSVTAFTIAAVALIGIVYTQLTWPTGVRAISPKTKLSEYSVLPTQAKILEHRQDGGVANDIEAKFENKDVDIDAIAIYQRHLKLLSLHQLRKQHLLILENSELSERQKSSQLWLVGKEYFRFSDWQASRKAFNESIDIQRSLGTHKDPLQLSHALTSLAQVRSLIAQHIDSSRELLLEAKNLLSEHSINTEESAQILSVHAGLLGFADDYLGAEALLREAIQIAQSLNPAPIDKLVRFNTQLVGVLGQLGHFNEATALVNRVLGAETMRLGADNILIVPIMSEYADLLAKSGNHQASIEVYHRAIAIMQNSVASTHPRLRHVKLSLAKVLVELNEFEQAGIQYKDLIESEAVLKNKSPLRLSNLKLGLSDALIGAQKTEQAYKEAVEAVYLIEQQLQRQEPVPDWMRYTADSIHGAALIEIGKCGAGARLIQNAVNQMFRDGVSDPRISARIHERKSYYEHFGPCA